MIIIITLFYLSLITIVGMVGWKLVSLRKHKLSLIAGAVEEELHSSLYGTLEQGWHLFVKKYLVQARTFATALFYTVANVVLRFVLNTTRKIQARHGKWYDMVKGKGTLKKRGAVSFFLQDVAEYKKSLKEGE